jgi:hypothetical protein
MTKLKSQNDYTKVYENEEHELEMYISKAYDEDTDKHYLVASIPEIKEFSVHKVQLPLEYETEKLRDESFDNFDGDRLLNLILEDVRKKQEFLKNSDNSINNLQN